EDVPLVQYRKKVRLFTGQHVDRLERRIPEIVQAGELDDAHQNTEVERPGYGIDRVGGHVELSANQRHELVRGRCVYFQPDYVAASPPPQLALDQLQMRPSPFV